MTYTVKYKLKNDFFWKSVKRVKGDVLPGLLGDKHFMLIREDESIVLLPIEGTQLDIDNNRFKSILSRMESTAGQKIPLKSE